MDYIKIDKTLTQPIYKQLADSIINAIKGKRLVDFDQLPSIYEICAAFHISDIVVRQAYRVLEEEGYIVRIKGSGEYIKTRQIYQYPLKGFEKEDFIHYNYQSKNKKVILLEIQKSDSNTQSFLNLPKVEDVFVTVYLIYIDDNPVMLQTFYLPKSLFPNLTSEKVENTNLPLLVERIYNYKIDSIENQFFPANATSYQAKLLKIPPQSAVHFVRSKIISNGTSVAYFETYYPGEYSYFEWIER